jgi:hypothetical protein
MSLGDIPQITQDALVNVPFNTPVDSVSTPTSMQDHGYLTPQNEASRGAFLQAFLNQVSIRLAQLQSTQGGL